MKKIALIATGLFALLPLAADAASIVFQEMAIHQSHGDKSASNVVSRFAVDARANVYTVMPNVGDGGFIVKKYDSYGNKIWEKTHAMPSAWYNSWDLAVDNNGNVYVVTGNAYEYGKLFKYDANGNESLIGTGFSYNPGYNNRNRVIIKYDQNSDSIYIAGGTYLIQKYTPQRTKAWEYSAFSGLGSLFGSAGIYDIVVQPAGNIYVVGSVGVAATKGYLDAAIEMVNTTSGTKAWSYVYDGGGTRDEGVSIDAMPNGNVAASVQSAATNTAASDNRIQIFNANGSLTNNILINYAAIDYPGIVKVGSDNSIYFTSAGYISKFSTNGTPLWKNLYPANYGNTPVGMSINGKGEVFLGITSQSGQHWSSSQFATVKYDTNGVTQWEKREAMYSNMQQMYLAPTGEIYVGGNENTTTYGYGGVVYRYGEAPFTSCTP